MKKLITIIIITIAGFSSLFGTNSKNYTTEQVLSSTLYFEARGENFEGKMAVASAIYNRSLKNRWKKLGLKGICLQRLQFSCFNDGFKMPNPKNKFDKKAYEDCKIIAHKMITDEFKPTHNATHYVTVAFYNKAKDSHWCKKMTSKIIIDNHIFGRA